jgi:hypothetical protein
MWKDQSEICDRLRKCSTTKSKRVQRSAVEYLATQHLDEIDFVVSSLRTHAHALSETAATPCKTTKDRRVGKRATATYRRGGRATSDSYRLNHTTSHSVASRRKTRKIKNAEICQSMFRFLLVSDAFSSGQAQSFGSRL